MLISFAFEWCIGALQIQNASKLDSKLDALMDTKQMRAPTTTVVNNIVNQNSLCGINYVDSPFQ